MSEFLPITRDPDRGRRFSHDVVVSIPGFESPMGRINSGYLGSNPSERFLPGGYCGRVVKAKDLKSFHESVAGSNPVNIALLFFCKRRETSYAHTSIDLRFACGFCQRSARAQELSVSKTAPPQHTQARATEETNKPPQPRAKSDRTTSRTSASTSSRGLPQGFALRKRRRRGRCRDASQTRRCQRFRRATSRPKTATPPRHTAARTPERQASPERAARRDLPRIPIFIARRRPRAPAPPWPSTRPS